jgi:hypothetical protein
VQEISVLRENGLGEELQTGNGMMLLKLQRKKVNWQPT